MSVMSSRKGKLSVFIVTAIVFGLSFFVWTHKYDVYDFWRLQNYDPSAEIVQIADATFMTDYGRRLFYVNRPELQNKDDFNTNCTISEQSIILGCYIQNDGIYLFKVTDDRLDGVHEVTAAHEMLHVAYSRLGDSERDRIDKLTNSVFESINNAELEKTIQSYRERDAAVVPNELHSILATEVRELPQELETYYAKYFKDRLKVVSLTEKYESAFRDLEQQVANYESQLTSLKERIDSLEISLSQQQSQLSNQRAQLDSYLNSGNNDAYNSAVPSYNQAVRRYNSDIATIQRIIDEFNDIVRQRNLVALEENELLQAIDSRPSTIPTE